MPQRVRKHTQEESLQELSSTEISPVTARVMTWVFVAMIVLVPLGQATGELLGHRPVGALSLFAPVGLKAFVDRDRLQGYEASLEADSAAKGFVQPRLQWVLTRMFGSGNHKVLLGRSGWLFYQPGLEHVAGPSVLDGAFLQVRAKRMVDKRGGAPPHPDPLPALTEFARGCERLGVRLILMPIPDKVTLQPAELTARLASGALPRNSGWDALLARLRALGIAVFDATSIGIPPGADHFLRTDTHWTPEFMEACAARLAADVRATGLAAPNEPLRARVQELRVARVGDLVDMLKLPPGQRYFPPQEVRLHAILDPNSEKPTRPEPGAPVLLLGDSFVNVYSSPAMGWGAGAGLGEHLAYRLGQPIDVIAINGGGASGVRSELLRAENAARLSTKRVIVYEFSARDLSSEEWLPLPVGIHTLPEPRDTRVAPVGGAGPTAAASAAAPKVARMHAPSEATRPRPTSPSPAASAEPRSEAPPGQLVVIARVDRVSAVPQPFGAPYGDCLTAIRLQVEQVEAGSYQDDWLLAVFSAMKENRWLPAANYRPGQRLRLHLILFRDAPADVRATKRVDDTDDYEHLPYYVVGEEERP